MNFDGIGAQIFNFLGYQCDLPASRMGPTKERWLALTGKSFHYNTLPIVGLLMATEKQAHMGCLHLIPAQCHLKNPSTARMNGKRDPSSSGIAPTFKVMFRLTKHAVTAATPSTHLLCTVLYRYVKQG